MQTRAEADRLGRKAADLEAKSSSLARELEQQRSNLTTQLQAAQEENQQVTARPWSGLIRLLQPCVILFRPIVHHISNVRAN